VKEALSDWPKRYTAATISRPRAVKQALGDAFFAGLQASKREAAERETLAMETQATHLIKNPPPQEDDGAKFGEVFRSTHHYEAYLNQPRKSYNPKRAAKQMRHEV
jgi:hypothetical protein